MRLKLWTVLAVLVLILGGAETVAAQQLLKKTLSAAGANCSNPNACLIIDDMRNVPSLGIYVDVGTSGTFNFEGSIDGVNWFAIQDDINGSSTLTADGQRFFTNPGYRQVRVRASAISGNAVVNAVRGFTGMRSTATLSGSSQGDGALQDGENASIEATVFDLTNSNPLATQIVDLNGSAVAPAVDVSHGSTVAASGPQVMHEATTSLLSDSPVADGQAIRAKADTIGRSITVPGCGVENRINGQAVITDGSSTQVIAALGAVGIAEIYAIEVTNSSASDVTVDLRDGTGGAVLWTVSAPAGAGNNRVFTVPLTFSANTAVAADPSAAASSVTVSVLGCAVR